MFVAASERKRLDVFAPRALESNTLLVTEGNEFGQFPGMITLVVAKNRIRFEIDLDAARTAGLEVNSRLLALATMVHTGTDGQQP